ncbi:pickpocket protein 28-like [Arctopsyche grandis]|uniref:pickpocket protein 28-like n=1 Tax=Arctopsyche grandis TaxID=121162 RepID=UPI00406D9D98
MTDTGLKSTFHGLQYLGTNNKKNNRLTRIGWAITIIASCIACVWICIVIRRKFNNNHTITSVVSHTYDISKIPFPSIAICNVNKVSKSKFQHFKNILLQNNVSEEEADAFGKSLSSLLTFSTFDYHMYNNNTYEHIFDILQKYNYPVDILMKELQQDCKNLLVACYMRSKPINCSQYFEMIQTSEGYCCAFNYKGIKHLLDGDYTNNSEVKREPFYVRGYQIFGGINVVFEVDKNDYLSPTKPIYGSSVLISGPIDYPDITSKSITIEYNQLIKIEVTPALVESASDLLHLDQDDRNCWMFDEVISMDEFYSFQTCMTRCRASAIYERCGCIPFYYPDFGYDLRRKCRLIDNQCLRSNQESFGLNCNCKYQCSDYFYKVSAHSSKIHHSAFYSGYLKASMPAKTETEKPEIRQSENRNDGSLLSQDKLF